MECLVVLSTNNHRLEVHALCLIIRCDSLPNQTEIRFALRECSAEDAWMMRWETYKTLSQLGGDGEELRLVGIYEDFHAVVQDIKFAFVGEPEDVCKGLVLSITRDYA